jgi:hypothetical protein
VDSDDALIIGAVLVGAYALYKLAPRRWDADTATTALQNAGAATWKPSALPEAGTFYSGIGNGTTVKFSPGDAEQLNFAQRTLITLDKVVPGTFLTRWALT